MKTALALSIIGVLYGIVSEMDYRDAVAQETARREFRAYVARNCIPSKPTELVTMKRERDGKLKCTTIENYGYGRTANVGRVTSN